MLNWILSLLGLGKKHVPVLAPMTCGNCHKFKARKRGGSCPFFVRGHGRSREPGQTCVCKSRFDRK